MSFNTKLTDLLKSDPRFKEQNGLEKHLLEKLLDKNQWYVNLSEIDDAQFKVREEDKRLNKAFYA